jgi:hypothetical protein
MVADRTVADRMVADRRSSAVPGIAPEKTQGDCHGPSWGSAVPWDCPGKDTRRLPRAELELGGPRGLPR